MSERPAAPSGFREMTMSGGFARAFGPIFWRLEPQGLVLTFQVAEQHINPRGGCHGGTIAAFLDMQVLAAQHEAGLADRFLPTVNLEVTYVAPAPLGSWLTMHTTLVRATRSLLFSEATINDADGAIVARGSGIYKVGRQPDERAPKALPAWADAPRAL